jgi:antitoxin (DNA-binding transcriptional repressor) of toxin-antitoxin stability system
MRQVTIQAAETSLPDLVDAALAGEEVVIARGDQPVVRLVPVSPAPTGKFKFGILNGKLGKGPDFLEPMDPENLALWEGGGDGRSA